MCFCGNSYGKYGISSSESDCNINCTFSVYKEKCGGFLKNSIYEIKSIFNQWLIILFIGKIFLLLNLYKETEIEVPKIKYLGCYVEVGSARDLNYAYYQNRKSISIDMCLTFCPSVHAKYMGLQYG